MREKWTVVALGMFFMVGIEPSNYGEEKDLILPLTFPLFTEMSEISVTLSSLNKVSTPAA